MSKKQSNKKPNSRLKNGKQTEEQPKSRLQEAADSIVGLSGYFQVGLGAVKREYRERIKSKKLVYSMVALTLMKLEKRSNTIPFAGIMP